MCDRPFYINSNSQVKNGTNSKAGNKLTVRTVLISRKLLIAKETRMMPPTAVNSLIIDVVKTLWICPAKMAMDP